MVSSVIGGFQKISKKREKSREEMDVMYAKKFKKPKRLDKRSTFQIQDNQGTYQEEVLYDHEY